MPSKLVLVALCLGLVSVGCKKSAPAAPPLPAEPSAAAACKALEGAKLVTKCRKSTSVPNGMSEADMAGISEVYQFDATFFGGGKTYPGEVIHFRDEAGLAGGRVSMAITSHLFVVKGPNLVHVQSARKDADPNYQKVVELVKTALP